MAKRGLGRGLDVLIGSTAEKEGRKLLEIPVGEIRPNPRQPRRGFDAESLEEMARSMEEFGVIQPVIVRPVGTEYELVAGERRWRAAVEAGLEKIPALVRESSETESLEMALIENLHRDDLNGIEEATAYRQLLEDFGITHEELSRRVGKSRVAITNTLRLLQLPASVQRAVAEGRITTGHARALLALQGRRELQEELVSRIAKEGISVRQVERIAAARGASREEPARKGKAAAPPEALGMIERLGAMLGTGVRAVVGKRKGKLIIEFKDIPELERIYRRIAGTGKDPSAGDGPGA